IASDILLLNDDMCCAPDREGCGMHQRLGARGTRARRVGPVTAGAMITLVDLPLLTGLLGAPAALASGAGDVTASQDNLRTGWDSRVPGLSPAALRDEIGRASCRARG